MKRGDGSAKRRGGLTFQAMWPVRGPGPRGRPCCRYCGREVPPGRADWCADACRQKALHEHSLVADPAAQRRAVFRRDRGVCATCGRDTLRLRRQLQHAGEPERTHLLQRLRQHGYDAGRLARLQLWEMDHVRPVAEGGGLGGLQNLQTLCVPCHNRKTAAERRRRGAQQQGQQDLFE